MTTPQTRLPTAEEDAQHDTPATALKAVAGFVQQLDGFDELETICGDVAASETTIRIVHEMRANVIAQALDALVKAATRAFRHASGAPEDIDGGFSYLVHRREAVGELAELVEIIARASDCDITMRIVDGQPTATPVERS